MGIFSFVAAGGGTLGVLLGGALTQATGWRSIFLINLPTGAVILGVARSPPSSECNRRAGQRLDLLGAVTIASSLMLAILGCSRANSSGWTAGITLTLLSGALAIFMLFLVVESRAPAPLMPLGMFRSRGLASANALAVLLRAAMFSWFFLSPLYMQRVLEFSVLETGLGFLPATLIIGAFSYSLTSRIVSKIGVRAPFVAGAVFVALGLGSFALAPPGGNYAANVLPGMLLIGVGGGLLFIPLILTATSSVHADHAGIASGLVSTSQAWGSPWAGDHWHSRREPHWATATRPLVPICADRRAPPRVPPRRRAGDHLRGDRNRLVTQNTRSAGAWADEPRVDDFAERGRGGSSTEPVGRSRRAIGLDGGAPRGPSSRRCAAARRFG